jgi:hypothetical protein
MDFHRNNHIAGDLEDYRNFFSDDWGKRIDDLTASTAKLEPLIFDLMMEWRAAAYTASLPALILEHMQAYHDSFVKTRELNTTLLRLANGIVARMESKLPELTSDPSLLRRIRKTVLDLGIEIEDARDAATFDFPMQETWQSYIKEYVYQLSLWGSQRICYVSIYNSYDNFLTQCIRIATGIADYRSFNRTKFKSDFAAAFGDQLLKKCCDNTDFDVARFARNSLSHSGGRLTPELAGLKHAFVVCDGFIHITPKDTKGLFALLKGAVYALAEEAITLSTFT